MKGENVTDDAKIAAITGASADTPGNAFIVFTLDKNAPAAQDTAAVQRTVSMSGPVKAGTGPITPDRELATELGLYLDSGTCYVTVTAKNGPQAISYEGKWSVSESNFASATLKEFKSKLAGFPKTSDRGVLVAASGSKNVKDQDKMGALGVKGKKGDTLKFTFHSELAAVGGVASTAVAAPVAVGDPAPDIDAKWRYHLVLSVSLMEGSIFLSITGNGEPDREGGALPEARKTAALPKVTFSVFKLSELLHLLKGGNWPVYLHGWAVFDRAGTKIKVPDNITLEKLGVVCPAQGSSSYNFTLQIDEKQPLPTGQ